MARRSALLKGIVLMVGLAVALAATIACQPGGPFADSGVARFVVENETSRTVGPLKLILDSAEQEATITAIGAGESASVEITNRQIDEAGVWMQEIGQPFLYDLITYSGSYLSGDIPIRVLARGPDGSLVLETMDSGRWQRVRPVPDPSMEGPQD